MHAQSGYFYFYFISGFPHKEFGQNVSKAFGVGITGGYRLWTTPVVLGTEFAFLIYELDFDLVYLKRTLATPAAMFFPVIFR